MIDADPGTPVGRWRSPLCRMLVLVAMLTVLASPAATAHELPVTTGTITLRAGHLELRLNVDLRRWMDALDTTDAPSSPEPPSGRRRALECLVRELRVVVDGRDLKPVAIRFPSDAVVRALRPHEFVQVVAEVVVPMRPRAVEVTLPGSLGEASLQLVEPRTRAVGAGRPARFDLTVPAADSSRVRSPKPHRH